MVTADGGEFFGSYKNNKKNGEGREKLGDNSEF